MQKEQAGMHLSEAQSEVDYSVHLEKPRLNMILIMQTDASGASVGALLNQEDVFGKNIQLHITARS